MTEQYPTQQEYQEALDEIFAQDPDLYAYITGDACEVDLECEDIEVICEHCQQYYPLSDCREAGRRVGPDLISYVTYICAQCDEEMEDTQP